MTRSMSSALVMQPYEGPNLRLVGAGDLPERGSLVGAVTPYLQFGGEKQESDNSRSEKVNNDDSKGDISKKDFANVGPVIITADDFRKQQLRWSKGVNDIVDPNHTIDPRLEIILNEERVQPEFFQYQGVKVLSRRVSDFPNVTLAHYAVSNALRERGVSPGRFIDLGCGVGFNGNYASLHFDTKNIVFADLSPQAMNHVMGAYQMNHGGLEEATQQEIPFGVRVKTKKHNLDLKVGDAAQTLIGMDADVAVAAPMFVPGVCEVFPQAYNIFAGVARSTGARLFVGHSSLATPWVEQAANLNGMNMEVLDEKRVPLRLEYNDGTAASKVQVQSGVMLPQHEEAMRSFGLEVNETNSDLPRYYHKLTVSQLSER